MSEAADINTAIPAYLGYQRASHPQTDWPAVVGALGIARAQAVEIPMLRILGALGDMQPDWRPLGLWKGSEWAVRALRKAHPGIDDRAAKALVWAFSCNNR
ncbi:hypothetical protein FHR20_001974 [Sphingomonas leidyi]|uniref:Uncharacterized protein n=1 Tax=Sphingomonas leidyi TaxID=68569 RepID=A0A7X5V0I3_9SPHN|nr:hypothetical protein [Sphingomonas leidyi]NIJ65012.1 hypothetical protein [Sphingomonas leidyi]